MMNLWDDPRIVRGMTAQFALRRQRLDGGDKLLGWKVGFGAPALLKQFNTSGPLVGFLTENARVAPGSTVSLAGWAKPVAEPEVAVYIACDVAAGTTLEAAADAIAGISPAIELADLHEPATDPERILSHDIYQRHVVLAAFGERLRAGEVIITGSVVPPIAIEPDESSLAFALDPVGAISVNFKR